MGIWFRFLTSLESGGGTLIILILLIAMFALFAKLGFKDAEAQIYFILGALIGIIKGRSKPTSDSDPSKDKKEKEILNG